MKPAARNAIFPIPAVVWLALCVTLASPWPPRARAATALPPPATTTTTTTTTSPAAAAPAAPRTAGRDLLAFGTDERFWSADVIPVTQAKAVGAKTFLRVRGPGDS